MFEVAKNLIFFCIFLAIGITGLKLSIILSKTLIRINKKTGTVGILGVDFKLIFKWLLSLSLSSTIAGFISAIFILIEIF